MAKISITADVVALSTGSIVLAALAGTLLTAGQAGHDLLLNDRHQHLAQGMLGVAMVLLPIIRRLIRQICNPGDSVEFVEIARSLRKMGMSSRVRTINRYLGEQETDGAWRSIFGTQQDLWDWLGEAYQDKDLRSQMFPKVALRAAEAGHRVGSLPEEPVSR